MHDMQREKIKIAIRYNKVIDYLRGAGTYKVNSDPRDRNSLHAYGFAIEIYNEYSLEHSELKLNEIFETVIIDKLKSDDCNFFDVYCLFNCIKTQLGLQKSHRSSFNISDQGLQTMSDLLKDKVNQLEETLKICKSEGGARYENGMYGYMQEHNERLYGETGYKLI